MLHNMKLRSYMTFCLRYKLQKCYTISKLLKRYLISSFLRCYMQHPGAEVSTLHLNTEHCTWCIHLSTRLFQLCSFCLLLFHCFHPSILQFASSLSTNFSFLTCIRLLLRLGFSHHNLCSFLDLIKLHSKNFKQLPLPISLTLSPLRVAGPLRAIRNPNRFQTFHRQQPSPPSIRSPNSSTVNSPPSASFGQYLCTHA